MRRTPDGLCQRSAQAKQARVSGAGGARLAIKTHHGLTTVGGIDDGLIKGRQWKRSPVKVMLPMVLLVIL